MRHGSITTLGLMLCLFGCGDEESPRGNAGMNTLANQSDPGGRDTKGTTTAEPGTPRFKDPCATLDAGADTPGLNCCCC